jgi:hypothetical protein
MHTAQDTSHTFTNVGCADPFVKLNLTPRLHEAGKVPRPALSVPHQTEIHRILHKLFSLPDGAPLCVSTGSVTSIMWRATDTASDSDSEFRGLFLVDVDSQFCWLDRVNANVLTLAFCCCLCQPCPANPQCPPGEYLATIAGQPCQQCVPCATDATGVVPCPAVLCGLGQFPTVLPNSCCPVCQNCSLSTMPCPPVACSLGQAPVGVPNSCCQVCQPCDRPACPFVHCPRGQHPELTANSCCPVCVPCTGVCAPISCDVGSFPAPLPNRCCPVCLPCPLPPCNSTSPCPPLHCPIGTRIANQPNACCKTCKPCLNADGTPVVCPPLTCDPGFTVAQNNQCCKKTVLPQKHKSHFCLRSVLRTLPA